MIKLNADFFEGIEMSQRFVYNLLKSVFSKVYKFNSRDI